MKCGIVGLPNAGKSTLFNALTKGHALIASYPFTTIEPNVGVISVPDENLDKLGEIVKSKKITPAFIEFVDIAGLVKGASKGEGLGNKFLANIREVDGIINVVRNFEDNDVSHVCGGMDPNRDIEIIKTELCLADIETIDSRLSSLSRLVKSGEEKYLMERDFFNIIKKKLNNLETLALNNLDDDEKMWLRQLQLLSIKPVLYIFNIDEEQLKAKKDIYRENTINICAKFEAELLEFSDEERKELLRDFGLEKTGLSEIIKSAYKMLDLITFFTFNENELRAWQLVNGYTASMAAGRVHTDMEKGFIKAEVISAFTLINEGSIASAREKGLVKIEGRDYVVKDNDIMYFKFNPTK